MTARARTQRHVNLSQLAAELGGAALTMRGGEPFTTRAKDVETDDVDQAALEAALTAHDADPDWGAPPSRRALTGVRDRARQVAAGTGADPDPTFTPAQLQRLVAALVLRQLGDDA